MVYYLAGGVEYLLRVLKFFRFTVEKGKKLGVIEMEYETK